ncbi:hypothetical protein PUR23_28020 [Methylorubrum populi]|uniref:Uncharacterized protein n=1 Tax=Methylorubrum extorquens (strain DSM 6343 / CIP 106787 / DM4) TaxID=661410 RepID=C7CN73_METED|nr:MULTISPECIES: hypothetical protein [Methylobacteriaceae]MBY0256237.1 hypothetical protein [Methylobacterium sp.]MDV2986876.1 hypothetical protein [Methylobacteriaceae bacterium AG10]CAX17103.1 protein of unknown function [Methylorubrum extorquens DM4]
MSVSFSYCVEFVRLVPQVIEDVFPGTRAACRFPGLGKLDGLAMPLAGTPWIPKHGGIDAENGRDLGKKLIGGSRAGHDGRVDNGE